MFDSQEIFANFFDDLKKDPEMKFGSAAICAGLLLFNTLVRADVPLPGVEMPAKVKKAFTFFSKSYQDGNIARLMQTRKARMQDAGFSAQSSVLSMSLPLLLGTYSDSRAVHSLQEFQDHIFANNPNGTMIDYYRDVYV